MYIHCFMYIWPVGVWITHLINCVTASSSLNCWLTEQHMGQCKMSLTLSRSDFGHASHLITAWFHIWPSPNDLWEISGVSHLYLDQLMTKMLSWRFLGHTTAKTTPHPPKNIILTTWAKSTFKTTFSYPAQTILKQFPTCFFSHQGGGVSDRPDRNWEVTSSTTRLPCFPAKVPSSKKTNYSSQTAWANHLKWKEMIFNPVYNCFLMSR